MLARLLATAFFRAAMRACGNRADIQQCVEFWRWGQLLEFSCPLPTH